MEKTYTLKTLFFSFLFSTFLITQAQECDIIYVTTTGANSGAAGTKANPASLNYGLTLVSGTANKVWIATGTYNITIPIQLVSNLTLEGGFDGTTWIISNS